MRQAVLLIIAGTLAAPVALAHSGVKDPTVQAWMTGMEGLAQSTKTLGQMAKGQSPFDPDTAAEALARIERRAADIPELFESQATDPKSEARDIIWTNWDDFVERSEALASVAATSDIATPDQLRRTLGRVGGACKSCHADYRE